MKRIAHTYSIVAFDPAARQWGVAVQTHYFAVGAAVPWAEAGIGVVATQSLTERSYGPLGLGLMRAGKTAAEALRALIAADPKPEVRQVAMVDAAGRVAVHTGERCIGKAGHHVGESYATLANLMLREAVWEAMAEMYESAGGDLAERMLQSLEAAERKGGDIRGRQSAALLVVGEDEATRPWAARLFDVRVDDAPDPLAELRRLVRATRVYDQIERASEALASRPLTDEMLDAARATLDLAREDLVALPGNPEPIVWYAVELANAGRIEEALPLFAEIYQMEPAWREVMMRLVEAGLLGVEPDALRLIAEA